MAEVSLLCMRQLLQLASDRTLMCFHGSEMEAGKALSQYAESVGSHERNVG